MIVNDVVCDRCNKRHELYTDALPNGWHKIITFEFCNVCYNHILRLIKGEVN